MRFYTFHQLYISRRCNEIERSFEHPSGLTTRPQGALKRESMLLVNASDSLKDVVFDPYTCVGQLAVHMPSCSFITVFDELKRNIRNNVFHGIFISFPLGSFAASRPSGMPQLRSEAEPLGITTVTGGPARCNHPRQRRFPSSREKDALHHG